MEVVLVVLEMTGEEIAPSSLPAITFAQRLVERWGAVFDVLVLAGPRAGGIGGAAISFGARTVWCASADALAHPTADSAAAVCRLAMAASGASCLVGAASSFGKDMLPRAAELADLPMVSDVIALAPDASGRRFQRPMYAGNITATVEISERAAAFSVRASAFEAPRRSAAQSEVREVAFEAANLPRGTEWISADAPMQTRPDLTSARVVVSGGRPLRDAETFERLLGGLADTLGGAVGATRAAVDGGLAPNELQIGQTGKVVAPALYIAAGISGSVQHLAGMKDSGVIVAINTDPDAPIFEVADYGLVADLHQAVPELTRTLSSARPGAPAPRVEKPQG
ncbi:MAG TPA: FAD-binding protein [Chthonomonadaceae bacterium]|nr:FAD-binding protein [Chthonomonadaceae bacterium]